MANTPKCPRCGSVHTQTSTDYKVRKGLGYVGEFVIGYAAGSILGDGAGSLVDGVNLHDRAQKEFQCADCGYVWREGDVYNPYDEKNEAWEESKHAPSLPANPSGIPVIDSFEGMSRWLSKLQGGASPAVKQAISAQMQVIQFVQSPTLVDTTFDTLMHSLDKSLSAVKGDKEAAGLREAFVLMIQNYIFFMDAKLQMAVNQNKEEGRKLFADAGELLSNSVKDIALLAVTGSTVSEVANVTVNNLFAPENENGGIRGLFRRIVNLIDEEQIIYEKKKDFYDTLGMIITKLGEHRDLIGASNLLSGTIQRYLPAMEEFYIAQIPEKPQLEMEIEKLQKNSNTICIVIGVLSGAWALVRAFYYWVGGRHVTPPDHWFLIQFLWTGALIGIFYLLYFFLIKDKQGQLDRLVHDVKDKVGNFQYIGRKYAEKKEGGSKVDALIDLKKLMDSGTITREEFDARVRQIRGEAVPSKVVQGPPKEELDYLEMFKEYAADGEISERDRKMLDKLRMRLGISEDRAKELEASCSAPQLTEDEQEYLEMFKEYAADGEISERDRKMLNKMRVRMGISEERAELIEHLNPCN